MLTAFTIVAPGLLTGALELARALCGGFTGEILDNTKTPVTSQSELKPFAIAVLPRGITR